MACSIVTALCALIATASPSTLATVLSVYDGDTIRVEASGYADPIRVRLLDIDAPEMRGACPTEREKAVAARAHLVELLGDCRVSLTKMRPGDRYGRLLARIQASGADVNARMVRDGYARPYGGHRRPWC